VPSFDVVKTSTAEKTFRVSSVIGAFDLASEKITEHFVGSIDIDEKEWNIGLIVGGSGTGKSCIAKELFGKNYINGYEYKSASVIDDMPAGKEAKEIMHAFTSVGFGSPPSWLKPYSVLSNGEKMRCDLARAMLEERQVFVFDEFTSVVNRSVAQTGSLAIQKAVRKTGKKFVAVSCHADVVEWLMPDWIYNTDESKFFFANNGKNQELHWNCLSQTMKKKKYGECLGVITI